VRLFLGVPTAGSPAAPFADSLSRIALPPATTAFERAIVTGNFVPAQRDVIVARAIEWNADVVVMCDDDMVVPVDILSRLCDTLDADPAVALTGALYYSRDGLRPMVVDGWNAGDTRLGWIPAFDDRTPVAVDGVGFGCVAIRVAALRSFQRPYFASQVYVEHAAGRVRVCNEDYLFCARLRAAGHTVLLHPGARCGHYDRGRDAIAPAQWEPPSLTNRKRVLVRNGESYELVALETAPTETTPERHLRAEVDYVETP